MKQVLIGRRRAADASKPAASTGLPQALGVIALFGVSVMTGFPEVAARTADLRLNESVSLLWRAPKGIWLNEGDLEVSRDGKRFAYRDVFQRSVVVDGLAGRSYKWVGSPTFSPDGRNVAYAAALGSENLVVLNGTDGQRYAKVGQVLYENYLRSNVVGLTFSPDSSRLAYKAVKPKGTQVLVVDGAESAEYDSVGVASFSADGRRIAFAARRARTQLLVVDGQERDLGTAEVSGLEFSPDGRQLAYVTRLDKVEAVTVGEARGNGFDKVGRPYFSPDGKHVTYMAQRKAKRFVVIDGVEGKPYDWIGRPYFSPDGRRTAYAASQGGFLDEKSLPNLRYKSGGAKYGVVTDGVEGTWFEGPVMPWVQFSPDGSRVAYWVLSRGKHLVMVDQTESGESEVVGGDLAFSPDGKRLAYTASRDPKGKKGLVVVDGAAQKEYSGVVGPVFSPDSRHLAYVAIAAGKYFIVVDGREALLDRGFERLLGGARAVSAYDLDDGTELEIRDKTGFAFEGSNVLNALARKGLEVYRVRVEIGEGNPGAQGETRIPARRRALARSADPR